MLVALLTAATAFTSPHAEARGGQHDLYIPFLHKYIPILISGLSPDSNTVDMGASHRQIQGLLVTLAGGACLPNAIPPSERKLLATWTVSPKWRMAKDTTIWVACSVIRGLPGYTDAGCTYLIPKDTKSQSKVKSQPRWA